MVNFKKNILLLFIILFSSCQDYYGIIDGGGLRSKRKNIWYINSRINPENIGIKTDVVYKNENIDNEFYFHFYKNGTLYRFYKDRGKVLDSSSFNPKKGDIGFVIKRGKKHSIMAYTFFDGGQFRKSEIKMKGDTLILYSKNGKYEFLSYFEKVKMPKEWLDYKPDF